MQRFATKEEALATAYGYASFRGVQAQVIDHVLAGDDALVVMATGGGKSLCYIVPALVLGRAALVVSPLVSLMEDQVAGLQARGLSATFLGTGQSDGTVWHRLDEFQFVFVTPELVNGARFATVMAAVRPCLVAIDEAHCVSEMGHDFRPDYRTLRAVRDAADPFPLIAVTATATKATRDDIVANLGLRASAGVFVTTVDRPNLTYTLHPCKDAAVLVREIRTAGGPAIVYVPTIKEVDSVSGWLRGDLPATRVGAYHGKMERDEKSRVHHAFLRDELHVVVATVAFGMGIDKPDVRLVVQWGVPKTVETYYQQAGRAGRDGDASRCVLFTAPSDWPSLERLLSYNVDEETAGRNLAGLRAMRTFCESKALCRRQALLRHFGEPPASVAKCGACDVCDPPPQDEASTVDVSAHARAVLEAAGALGGRYGVTTLIDVCRGSTKPQHARLAELACCGNARDAPVEAMRRAVDACRQHGLLEDVTVTLPERSYGSVAVTAEGAAWLAEEGATLRAARPSASRKRAASSAASLSSADDALLQRLRAVRREAANGLAPYMVCSDATLRDMIAKKPKNRVQFLGVAGIGAHKADKYAAAFTAVFLGA